MVVLPYTQSYLHSSCLSLRYLVLELRLLKHACMRPSGGRKFVSRYRGSDFAAQGSAIRVKI